MFPKAVLLAPYRMGKKTMKKKGSMATQVLERIRRWSCDREALWAEVLARASGRKKGLSAAGEVKGGLQAENSFELERAKK
jgi:hypothetical protein